MASPGYERQKIRFGAFELDVADRVLRECGNPIKLQPQPFEILVMLIESAGRVVSRDEIRKRIWAEDTFVDFERSINFSINQIRAALKDDSENPHFIETAPKRGYRFIATLESDSRAPHDHASDPIFIDRKPVEFAHPHSISIPLGCQEPAAPFPTVSDHASAQAAPALRKPLGRLILGSVLVIGVLACVLWQRNRPVSPAKVQQLTNNSNDNPITSVKVSPDGKYIAFADLGGLHVKLLKTGEVRDYSQPAELGKARQEWLVSWLPDSTGFLTVAWGLGTPSIWQASVLSGSMRLFQKAAVTWSISPDGSQFVFTTESEREMWVGDIEGSGRRKLADAGAGNWFSYIEWSPDGSHLLYIKRVAAGEHVQNIMEVQDLTSGSATTLLSSDSLQSLSWLPDGRILYVEGVPDSNGKSCHIWTSRLEGKSPRLSSRTQLLPESNGLCISSISTTADGKQLYFLKQTSGLSVYIADLATGATRISPPRHLTVTENSEFPVGWTADNRELVFVSNREGKWGFYRQSLNGDTATPILAEIDTPGLGAVFPRVTPDGSWLVYAPYHPDYVPGSPMDVLRVPISGGAPQLVMRAAVTDTPRCTRAPATLCAVASRNKDQMIITAFDVIRGAGQELARVKIDPDQDYTWDISPDSTRIATLKRGSSEIHVLSLRTRAEQNVVVRGWTGLVSLDWASDGKGLFTSSLASGSVLLYTDLRGNARVLWQPKGATMTWGVPSSDGRHLAMPGSSLSSNIWRVQDF